jgi:hypothetical protein
MRNASFPLLVVCALALVTALAVPASSQTLTAGIDVWTTPDDGSTYVDFSTNPLPAGFFCANSDPFAQRIVLKGSPIATNPAGVLGSTDTVVEREGDVDLSSGQGSTTIRVRAISFVNRSPISVPGCSDTFSAKVTLNGTAPAGSMTISGTAGGGTFDSSFSVPGRITFINNSTKQRLATTETVTLQTNGAPWADSVGTDGIAYPEPVSIDSDGNGSPDYATPGTTHGFAPGWWKGCHPPCPVKVDHNGPHPVWPLPPPPPPPPCDQAIVDAVSAHEADQAEPAGTAAATTDAAAVTVRSSTQYAGQKLTVIGATDAVTPCIAVTSTSTHLVSEQ